MEPRPQRMGFSPGDFRSPGEGLAWLGGLVLALSTFMSWYSFDAEVSFTVSITGWHTGTLGKLVFFIGLAVLGFLALRASGVELPPGVPGGMVIAGLGFLATIFVLIRVISIPDDFSPAGRSIGIWISLLAALLVIAAGLLRSAEEV
ncbi:MAG TPA: hypothetical protein VHQ96_07935 [Gaiellaceae bacterium]|jgi:hypothetical protein|nr:hypothetical protein [Gaiellaceae bacterium]